MKANRIICAVHTDELFQQLNYLETPFFNSGCLEIFIKNSTWSCRVYELKYTVYLHVFAGNLCCQDVNLVSHVQCNSVGTEVLTEVVTTLTPL